MPELPEVEVVKRGLSQILEEHPIIDSIEFKRRDLREALPLKKAKLLEGAKVLSVERRAKYLILNTDKARILSHLGMTGTWRVAPRGEEREHDHIYINLQGGVRLAYRDPRRFGYFDIYTIEKHPKLERLGPEPWDEDFTADYLYQLMKTRTSPIKVALMDQAVVVGVGNIYASEALFRSGIRPTRKAATIKRAEAVLLRREILQVLEDAIAAGGSTISDFAQAGGDSGYFQNSFFVYGRAGLMCLKCKQNKIKESRLGGRSTFWCSKCQS